MKNLNLLLLEDDAIDAELMMMILERSGMDFKSTIVSSEKEFIEAISTNNYDAILADNSLPQFNASNALKLTKKHNINIPFILVTGTVSEEFAVDIMKEGAWDYVLKDRMQRLPNAVQGAVKRHGLQMDREKYLEEVISKEALMRVSEQLAHFGSWEIDLVNARQSWSDEYYRILDYDPGEVPPSLNYYFRKIHPDDLDRVKQMVENGYLEERQKYQCRILARNSHVKFIECEFYGKKDESGNLVKINGFAWDITARKNTEELLQQSEANLRTIFDNADTGYALLDSSFNIISFNRKTYYFSTIHLEGPIEVGKKAIDYFKPERKDIVRANLEKCLLGKTISYEVSYPGMNREETTWYNAGLNPVFSGGKVIGVIMSHKDITEKKKLELNEKKITADLLQRNKDLEHFAHIVSHNLRAPVAKILGISHVIQLSSITETEKLLLMDGLVKSIKEIDNVVIDLSQVTRVNHPVNEIKEEIKFSDILSNVTLTLAHLVENNDVIIIGDFKEQDSFVSIKSYVYSIFHNLVSNSVKYRRPGVPLTVSIASRKKKNSIELFFKDNGMGIDLKRRGGQVFGIYQRFHTEHAEGKGMGLFMVKTQVESLGGSISIESEVDKGTEFKITFNL